MRKLLRLIFCYLTLATVLPVWGASRPPKPIDGFAISNPGYFLVAASDQVPQHLCLPGYYCPGSDMVMSEIEQICCEYIQDVSKIDWTDDCPNEPVCPQVEVSGDDSYWSNCGMIPCPDGTTSNAGAVSASDCFAAVTEISCNAGTYLPANGSFCTQCLSNSYCPGGDYTPGSTNQGINSCPSNYPNSVAGATTITQCYSNTKSRTWTGSQIACSVPTGCLSATCNECSGTPCNYTVYSNSNGNGDGTLRSGCSTNNASCQQTIGNAIADANYYANGTSCTACPSGTFSPSGSTSIDDCGKILHIGDYIAYMPVGRRTEHGLCTMFDGKKYCADVYERQ